MLLELFVFWAICVVVSFMIGSSKGRPTAGFLCGAFLGALGVLVAAFLRSSTELDHAGASYIDAPKAPRKLLGESEASFQERIAAGGKS